MPNKIDIRNINRKKLGEKLHYGDRVEIRRRLAARGISVSDKTVGNAFDPRFAIGRKIAPVLRETLAFLTEKHEGYQVAAHPELAEELQGEES